MAWGRGDDSLGPSPNTQNQQGKNMLGQYFKGTESQHASVASPLWETSSLMGYNWEAAKVDKQGVTSHYPHSPLAPCREL